MEEEGFTAEKMKNISLSVKAQTPEELIQSAAKQGRMHILLSLSYDNVRVLENFGFLCVMVSRGIELSNGIGWYSVAW